MSNTAPAESAPVQNTVSLRLAKVDDVDALVELFRTFFHESRYSHYLTFDRDLARRYLTTAISTGFEPHIVAVHNNGRVVGVISYKIDDSFSNSGLAVMGEVYALKEYRRSRDAEFIRAPLGRRLIHAAMHLAKNIDRAKCMHIPIASGHASANTLINLFKKLGAEEIGVILKVPLSNNAQVS